MKKCKYCGEKIKKCEICEQMFKENDRVICITNDTCLTIDYGHICGDCAIISSADEVEDD